MTVAASTTGEVVAASAASEVRRALSLGRNLGRGERSLGHALATISSAVDAASVRTLTAVDAATASSVVDATTTSPAVDAATASSVVDAATTSPTVDAATATPVRPRSASSSELESSHFSFFVRAERQNVTSRDARGTKSGAVVLRGVLSLSRQKPDDVKGKSTENGF